MYCGLLKMYLFRYYFYPFLKKNTELQASVLKALKRLSSRLKLRCGILACGNSNQHGWDHCRHFVCTVGTQELGSRYDAPCVATEWSWRAGELHTSCTERSQVSEMRADSLCFSRNPWCILWPCREPTCGRWEVSPRDPPRLPPGIVKNLLRLHRILGQVT